MTARPVIFGSGVDVTGTITGASLSIPGNVTVGNLSASGETDIVGNLSVSALDATGISVSGDTDIVGDLSCGVMASDSIKAHGDIRTLTPADVDGKSFRILFGSLANDDTSPFCDNILLSTWDGPSGGYVNCISVRKGTGIGIRCWSGVYDSSASFSNYADVVMMDQGSTNVTLASCTISGAASVAGTLNISAASVTGTVTLSGTMDLGGGTVTMSAAQKDALTKLTYHHESSESGTTLATYPSVSTLAYKEVGAYAGYTYDITATILVDNSGNDSFRHYLYGYLQNNGADIDWSYQSIQAYYSGTDYGSLILRYVGPLAHGTVYVRASSSYTSALVRQNTTLSIRRYASSATL